jgi:hypothetical protein
MSTGLDDDVQIVEKPWEEAVLELEEYKTALAILDSRKYGSPSTDVMRKILSDFISHPADYFIDNSAQASEYKKIEAIIRQTSHGSKSTRDKK